MFSFFLIRLSKRHLLASADSLSLRPRLWAAYTWEQLKLQMAVSIPRAASGAKP